MNVSALGLFAPIPGLPTFNVFHWGAIFTAILVALGVWSAKHQRNGLAAYSHPVLMVASYDMLLGGAINEAFARVDALRVAAIAGSPWAHSVLQTRLLTNTQAIASSFCILLALSSVVQVAFSRRKQRKLTPA